MAPERRALLRGRLRPPLLAEPSLDCPECGGTGLQDDGLYCQHCCGTGSLADLLDHVASAPADPGEVGAPGDEDPE